MRKILISILLILFSLVGNNAFAFSIGKTYNTDGSSNSSNTNSTNESTNGSSSNSSNTNSTNESTSGSSSNSSESNKIVTVTITEMIPGVKILSCKKGINKPPSIENPCKVEVKQGFGSVKETIANILKAFAGLAYLFGVLFITINGIMITMSGIDSGFKESAKGRIMKTIYGLILLSLSGFILNLLFPWIFT